MEAIAVVGAGMMGPGIAQVFASRGRRVHLYDTDRERLLRAKDTVGASLSRMADYGLVAVEEIPRILGRMVLEASLAGACDGAGVVIEAITEDLALKQELFRTLDGMCPPAVILCSNTSVISITQIGAASARRERILGTHFYQPPYLVPLVEVVSTEFAAPEHVDRIFDLMKEVGKVPVRVRKDVPGFIANRMQHALWREAFALIDSGVCDAETVDVAVQNSFGLRLPVLGPVTAADLVGLDLTAAIHEYVLPHLDRSTVPSATLRAHVTRGELGFKTRRGFLEWTEESMAATRERLTTYLLEVLSGRRP